MNASRMQWLAAALLLVPCLAWTQQPSGPGPASSGGASLAQRAATPAPSTKLYEDIEIMRRMLERELRGIYGIASFTQGAALIDYDGDGRLDLFIANGTNPAIRSYFTGVGDGKFVDVSNMANTFLGQRLHDPHGDPHRGVHLPMAEGVYLPGHGVVYTMTLPPPSEPTKSETPKPAKKPLSDWERTRKELRGEKIEADPPAEQQPPSVSGTILKLLADNGHHFSQLKEQDNITVAITFRQKWSQWNTQCMSCHASPWGEASGKGANIGMDAAGFIGAGSGTAPSGGSGAASAASGAGSGGLSGGGKGGSAPGYPGGDGGPAGLGAGAGGGAAGYPAAPTIGSGAGSNAAGRGDYWTQIEDRVLLGDLHVKQGRHKEALEAYTKASETLEHYMNNTWHWDKDQVKAARELYGKLIQTNLAAGDNEAAKKVMDKIDKIPAPKTPFPQVAQGGGGGGGPAKPPAVPHAVLPSKMIVSASKQLLDQVGSGKLSIEDFKKAASVQYLTFGATDARPMGSGSGSSKPAESK
jgi:hypothetical protein